MQKLKPGDLVRLRQARWHVVDVRPFEACEIVTLSSTAPAEEGVERRFISPFDSIEPIDCARRVRRIGPRRWRRTCAAMLASHAPPGGIHHARHARMDMLPYQLEPALAILRGLGSRVLLADDVGLGKTLQAGLVAAELRGRRCADRILILTPTGLRDQWAAELGERLAITSSIADAAEIRRRVATLPPGVNPWTTMEVVIASIDYVKRPEVLPAVASSRWDVVIVDEAHGAAGDSDRRHAVSVLAGRAAYVLLLTATPHSGDSLAFASLCAIGRHTRDPLLVFRRSRRDVGVGGSRRVHRLLVRPSAAEAWMHALLDRFARAVRRERGDAAALALSVLHKRALSSARSLERSVVRRLDALATNPDGTDARLIQALLPLDEGCGELSPADEPPPWSDDLALADPERERRMLGALVQAARAATSGETKVRALRRLLRRIGEPALVFTEYRDTLIHLRACLGGPIAVIHGGLNRADRLAALADFATGRCPILLATDAAGEGLNLHQSCRLVINLELPWNPVRLEQRIGRVDRIGQRRTVHAVHLIARHTREPRILDRLKERVARARENIDTPDPLGGHERHAAVPYPEGCTFPRLATEAFEEAARIFDARRVTPAVHPNAIPSTTGPLMMRARHRATRVRLGNAAILLFQAALEDGCGRIVESTLVPVELRMADGFAWRWSDLSAADLRRLQERLRPQLTSAVDRWRGRAAAIATAFTAMRVGRERSIAEAIHASESAVQRGLFDRRADAALRAASASIRDEQTEHQRRIAEAERAAALSFQTSLLLIVSPR